MHIKFLLTLIRITGAHSEINEIVGIALASFRLFPRFIFLQKCLKLLQTVPVSPKCVFMWSWMQPRRDN